MKTEVEEKTLDAQNRFRILIVSTLDIGGGAELSAWNLFNTYRSRGYDTELAVGTRHTNSTGVELIPRDSCRNAWARFWISAGKSLAPLETWSMGPLGRVRG